MKDKTDYDAVGIDILEIARLACAHIPDVIQDELDLSDEAYLEIRDYIHHLTPVSVIIQRRRDRAGQEVNTNEKRLKEVNSKRGFWRQQALLYPTSQGGE